MSQSLPSKEGTAPRRGRRQQAVPWIGGAILIVLGVVFLLQTSPA